MIKQIYKFLIFLNQKIIYKHLFNNYKIITIRKYHNNIFNKNFNKIYIKIKIYIIIMKNKCKYIK